MTDTPEEWKAKSYKQRWQDGYDWKPWTPYSCSETTRLKRALCNALGTHMPARGGSWCFGASICGRCGMNYNKLPLEVREAMAERLNAMPAEEQQMAAARMSGGGPPHDR